MPHCPSESLNWEGSRPYHLIRKLAAQHEIHWINWEHCRTPRSLLSLGHSRSRVTKSGVEHTVSLAPLYNRFFRVNYPYRWQIAHNQVLFRRHIRSAVESVNPDVLVYSDSFHVTGFPPFDHHLPVVFDYVDKGRHWKTYANHSTRVVAVSEKLCREVGQHKPAELIPNGVDVARYRAVSRNEAKQRLGFADKHVISLIGLTLSRRLYFLDAIAGLPIDRRNLVILVVGAGDVLPEIRAKAAAEGLNLIAPGFVPHAEIHWYFAASDVGLYPCDDIPYFNEAAPLKVMEYTAARVPVVSSPVAMFRDWPNVLSVPPSAECFRDAISKALVTQYTFPNLSELDWEGLAQRFSAVLDRARRGKARVYPFVEDSVTSLG